MNLATFLMLYKLIEEAGLTNPTFTPPPPKL